MNGIRSTKKLASAIRQCQHRELSSLPRETEVVEEPDDPVRVKSILRQIRYGELK